MTLRRSHDALRLCGGCVALLVGCEGSPLADNGTNPWPPCESIEHELDPALLDDPEANTIGWAGFVRQQLDGLARGAASDLTWYGHTSTDVLVASPDSGTTTLRIDGSLAPGPIRYEQPPSNSVELECVPDVGFVYLPLEIHVTTDDGALDEVWRAEGSTYPWGGPPEEGEPSRTGPVTISLPEFPRLLPGRSPSIWFPECSTGGTRGRSAFRRRCI